jgi:hypothetical protein
MTKRTDVVDVPRPGVGRRNYAALRRFLSRLETIVTPGRAEGAEAIGERVVNVGVLLSIAGVLVQTAMHLTDIVVFDRGVNSFDADEDFGVSSWASIVATFAAGFGAMLVGLVVRRGFFFLLAALLAFLSLDDFILVHERVGELVTLFGFDEDSELKRVVWPVFFMPLLAAAAVLLWLAARQFSGRPAWLVRAGLVALVLAVVFEAASSALLELGFHHRTWPYEFEVILEEGAELAGWIWIATGLTAIACSELARPERRP